MWGLCQRALRQRTVRQVIFQPSSRVSPCRTRLCLGLLRQRFEEEFAKISDPTSDERLLEITRTLTALPPQQAKDQMLRLLRTDGEVDDAGMHDLVTIVRLMPLDKRKKILAEFRSQQEQQQLSDILRHIRLGVPAVELIRQTRESLALRR